jgi:hypothetical protein
MGLNAVIARAAMADPGKPAAGLDSTDPALKASDQRHRLIRRRGTGRLTPGAI